MLVLPHNLRCPKCGYNLNVETNLRFVFRNVQYWRCRSCGYKFSIDQGKNWKWKNDVLVRNAPPGETNVLVVGLGETGRPLYEILKEAGFNTFGYDIDDKKVDNLQQSSMPATVDVMHICIPCFGQEKFVKTVLDYVNSFPPKLLIVNSTVVPRTTERIQESCKIPVVHSPIRGRFIDLESMKADIRRFTKFIGSSDKYAAELACIHFVNAGLEVAVLRNSLETELAKIFSTTYAAWIITLFQEFHRIARYFNVDFKNTLLPLEETQRLKGTKPLWFPGVIGGHCLIPNLKLLLDAYNSTVLSAILSSNELRKEEMKNQDIHKETKQIKARIALLKRSGIQK